MAHACKYTQSETKPPMPIPTIHHHPSLESTSSVDESVAQRHSLYDAKDDFINRVAPIGMAAMYFGSFTLAPQDAALSRQALFKLSFLNRHFLQPGGLRILVQRQTATLSGKITGRTIATLAQILAHQIDGITNIEDETEVAPTSSKTAKAKETEAIREAVALLFATDQTLRTSVQVTTKDASIVLEGQVASATQKSWAEQLVEAAGGHVHSKLKISPFTPPALSPANQPPQVDDESLQAFILMRLRLVRETEHLPVRVKATRGVVSLQGKVRTEALRQRVENLARSALGLRELRSSLSIAS